MKLIPLTQGKFSKVDDEDFERFGHLKWSAHWRRSTKSFYAVRNTPIDKNGGKHTIQLSRAIMEVTDRKIRVDHKNHDTLDNQRGNLRICTVSQNGMNRRGPDRDSTSKIRGVYWHKLSGKWQASITVEGKQIYLGLFSNMKLAAAAYTSANKKHFGEFGGVV